MSIIYRKPVKSCNNLIQYAITRNGRERERESIIEIPTNLIMRSRDVDGLWGLRSNLRGSHEQVMDSRQVEVIRTNSMIEIKSPIVRLETKEWRFTSCYVKKVWMSSFVKSNCIPQKKISLRWLKFNNAISFRPNYGQFKQTELLLYMKDDGFGLGFISICFWPD